MLPLYIVERVKTHLVFLTSIKYFLLKNVGTQSWRPHSKIEHPNVRSPRKQKQQHIAGNLMLLSLLWSGPGLHELYIQRGLCDTPIKFDEKKLGEEDERKLHGMVHIILEEPLRLPGKAFFKETFAGVV